MEQKLRNYYVFDESDPFQRELAAAYPAKRRLMCILRTVLLGLLVLAILLPFVAPICAIRVESRERTYGKTYYLSLIDLFPGWVSSGVQGMELVAMFEANGGRELLDKEKGKTPTDRQIENDVTQKRSMNFNNYARMTGLGSYLSAVESIRSDLWRETTKLLSVTTNDEDVYRELLEMYREAFDKDYESFYDFLDDVVDLFAYEFERLNFGGVRKVLAVATLAVAADETDLSWYDETVEKYLLGSYRAEDILSIVTKMSISGSVIGEYLALMPDYQDAYYSTSSNLETASIYTVATETGTYLSAPPVLSIFVTVFHLILLIFVLFSIISVVRSWKYPDRRIRGSGYSIPLVYPCAIMLLIMQLVVQGSLGAVYAGTMSVVCFIPPVFSILVFVYEIVFDVMVKKFSNRFRARAGQFE